ncbi:hypothetical protein KIPB_004213 [Kipferlia bialata]|uniref:Uncharacterized protein n=1 Tax=Kipferlia bialata TaxID=797122 RepID=A0A9K3GHL4_9EUKA|nr:hypothetical protein KIPB_004213 [Kipferlia bialata]|eukprot:g4213.t1
MPKPLSANDLLDRDDSVLSLESLSGVPQRFYPIPLCHNTCLNVCDLTFHHITRHEGVAQLVPPDPGVYSACPFDIGFPRAGCRMGDRVFIYTTLRRREQPDGDIRTSLPAKLLIYTVESEPCGGKLFLLSSVDNGCDVAVVYPDTNPAVEKRWVLTLPHTPVIQGETSIVSSSHFTADTLHVLLTRESGGPRVFREFVYHTEREWQEAENPLPYPSCTFMCGVPSDHLTLAIGVFLPHTIRLIAFSGIGQDWTDLRETSFIWNGHYPLTATQSLVRTLDYGTMSMEWCILHVDHSYIHSQGGVLTAEDFQ